MQKMLSRYSEDGRWGDEEPAKNSTDAVMPITIYPAQPRCLEVALIFDGDSTWHAITRASHFYGWRPKEYQLAAPIKISLELRGNREPVKVFRNQIRKRNTEIRSDQQQCLILLRCTQAMAAGVTGKVWELADLVNLIG